MSDARSLREQIRDASNQRGREERLVALHIDDDILWREIQLRCRFGEGSE